MKKLKLFSLTWPIFVDAALFMALGFVDTYMLSQYSDFAAGAISSSNQLLSFINFLFMIIAGGSTVLLAQYLGARDEKSAQEVMGVGLALNLIVGIILSVILYVYAYQILTSINLTKDLMPHALIYIKTVGSFVFFRAINTTLSGFIRTHGYTRHSMYISVLMNIINIILDVVLIFGLFGLPAMGSKGAAIATVISAGIATFIFIIYSFKSILTEYALKHVLSIPAKTIKKVFKIGIPSAIEGISFNLTEIVLTALLFSTLGQEAVIARTYISNIIVIAIIFSFSIGQSTQIMVGHLVGAKDYRGAYKVGLRNFFYAVLLTTVAAIMFTIFARPLMSIFTSDPKIIEIGVSTLYIYGFLEPGRAFNMIFVWALRGVGDITVPVIICIIIGWTFRIGLGYLFGVTMGFGLRGFIFAILLDEWFRGLIMFIRWKRFKWVKYTLID